MIDRVAERFGHRGCWLVLMGTAWFFFGVGIVLEPVPTRDWVLYEYLPPVVQAAGWWITGALAVWQGLRGSGRIDAVGHVALYTMPAVRLLSFIVSWLVYLGSTAADALGLTDEVIGYKNGWYAASIWLLIQGMLALAAAWPNPAPIIPAPPQDAGTRE